MTPEALAEWGFFTPPQANDGQYGYTASAGGNPLNPSNQLLLLAQFWEQQSITVDTAPRVVDITQCTGLASNPTFLNQGMWLLLDPRDSAIFVRFRGDNGAPGTTPYNGERIYPSGPIVGSQGGGPQGITGTDDNYTRYWLSGQMFQYMDIVATEPGTNVVFRRCSMARVRK
jgi:hypothetical protein